MTLRFLVFRVSDKNFALPLDAVGGVLPLPVLDRPPHLPQVIGGFFSLRGRTTSVLRLDRLLGLPGPEEPDFYAPLILLRPGVPETGTGPVALLADKVRSVREIPEASVLPLSDAAIFNGCVVATLGGLAPTAHVLAPDRLLLEREQRCLAEHRALAERRLADLTG
ncbi:MAG: chemotaxis protein CheW [Alphaproteobacteria bacterium]